MGSYFSKGNAPTIEDKNTYKSVVDKSFKASSYEDAQAMVLKYEELIYVGRFFFSKITKDDIDKLKVVLGDRELIMVEDGVSYDRYFDLYTIRDKEN